MPRSSARPELHAVLLAGGSGTRFWPLSRSSRPKQMLALAGGKDPLLVQTWKRVRRLAPPRRIWVVTPAALADQVRGLLPSLRVDNLVVEPSPRDTAPAIALACAAVARTAPEAVVAIFPTDHVIRDPSAFVSSVNVAARVARKGALVCLGIRPDRPATGFGYLRCASRPVAGKDVGVSRFVEKPALARARRFLRSGQYLWNGGMFVWRVDRFLAELDRTAPGIHKAVASHLKGSRTAWKRAQRLSVDYAVMEQARGVRVVPLDAGWDDVGSWDAAARLREETATGSGRVLLVDSPGSVVFGEQRTVAVVDVPGVVIVDTPDALLVVSREGSESVKKVVAELQRQGRTRLL